MPKKNNGSNPLKTAGRLMTSKVPTVSEKATVADAEALLLRDIAKFETINYIYILSKTNKLRGVISIKEVFRSPKSKKVIDLKLPEIIMARVNTDQQRVAFLALHNNLKAIPIVDKNNRFLGVVASDDILRVIDSEAIEDILRLGGVWQSGPYDNIFNISLARSIKHRLPWLVFGLAGGMLAAGIVSRFEGVIAQNLILAAFIPLIVYMADAVGTQLEAFIIRDLAIMPKMKFLKYFFRQISVILVIALIISSLLIITVSFLYGQKSIGFIVGIALFFAIISSVFTGLIIPYVFNKLRFDPANSSGPVATIIQDILSILVYFLVASWLL